MALRDPVRPERIAQTLEYNLYFHKRIRELEGKKMTKADLFDLRKDIRDRGIADLSPYWNDLLEWKIRTPELQMRKLKPGGAHIASIKTDPDEMCRLIHVYPETTERDVISAFRAIQEDFPKRKAIQAINEDLYEFIFERLLVDQKTSEILDDINKETGFKITDRGLREIVRKMKIGL